ncbi:MAG: hypothetical protein WBW04_13860, partial [Nitrolancea sp.]
MLGERELNATEKHLACLPTSPHHKPAVRHRRHKGLTSKPGGLQHFGPLDIGNDIIPCARPSYDQVTLVLG